MKYLVLGSAGQIGNHLCEYIESLGHSAIRYDSAESPLQDLRVCSKYLYQLMGECDFVFFLAFDVGGSRYLKAYQDSEQFIKNNMFLMAHTFEALALTKKPFIFASSQMSSMGHSTYGLLKAIGERYTHSIGGMVVRLWNVYGVEHNPEKFHVVTDFIKMAREGEIDMITDGQEERQMLYADDCSRAFFALSDKYCELEGKKEFHISSFKWHKVIDIALTVARLIPECGKIIRAESQDEVQHNTRNEPDTAILEFWKPTTSLEEGIKKVIEATK